MAAYPLTTRYLTSWAANTCYSSLKTEFIGVSPFYVHPIILDKFPSRLAPGGTAEFLPFLDSKFPELLMARKFLHDPMRAIFFRDDGFH